ncbi:NADPH-dependent FMN reductase [Methylocapsa sp. S129]|uniref:NADPH-dependent FMN reductase n=1 Tax=Methylocapsa sp. S129 TaxID=1641869 RepID=UPI001FEF1003|nr:NAD(P)H-dependent oxidoreductase [Methylocapsa sp. S129]
MRDLLIVGIGGATRPGSSSETALRIALAGAEALGARTQIFAGQSLLLPLFAPERPERSGEALALIASLRRADGVIISSPGYHGSISGLIKNALDYTEDMRNDPQPYFDGRAVGCIACAAGWQATGSTLAALRSIVHALRGWPTPFGVSLNSSEAAFDQGVCVNPDLKAQLALVGAQVVAFAESRRALQVVADKPSGDDYVGLRANWLHSAEA